MRTAALVTICMSSALTLPALPAQAQDYGSGSHAYYLHQPSNFQQGCWGPCACALTPELPMRGGFTLSLAGIGSVTDFYTISAAHFVVPPSSNLAQQITLDGSGTFSAGQVPFATHQNMSLNLTMTTGQQPPLPPQQFNTTTETGNRSVPPPVIAIQIANSTTGCPGVRTRLIASWYRSDYDASGVVSVADILEFLNGWFGGSPYADFDGSGALAVPDIIAFINAWFAGV